MCPLTFSNSITSVLPCILISSFDVVWYGTKPFDVGRSYPGFESFFGGGGGCYIVCEKFCCHAHF